MGSNSVDISVVVPVYGCDGTLFPLYERVAAAVAEIPATFELIFVDDCGPGDPWELITAMAQRDPRVVGLKLSRNFGQHSAIMAGVEVARGAWLVIMDCDLQDRPEEIPRLWAKAHEGYDAVVGRRVERKDTFIKRLNSYLYNRFFSFMTDQKSDSAQSSYGIYSRELVNVVKQFSENPRIFPLLVRWTGFKSSTIIISHGMRAEGKSSYTLKRQLSLAFNLIISHSNKPLRICVDFGFIMAFSSFLYGTWLAIRHLFFNHAVEGWTSVMVSLYFLSGLILFGIGIQGVYIGRIFDQGKKRPLYVVRESTTSLSVKLESVSQ